MPQGISLYWPEPQYVLYICPQFSKFLMPGSLGAQGHAPLIDTFTVQLSLNHLHSSDNICFLSSIPLFQISEEFGLKSSIPHNF